MELFRIKYERLKLRYLYQYNPIKNFNVEIDDVIHGSDIKTYDQAHGGNGWNIVLNTYLQTEIIVSIRMIIPK